jgi:hypothetical protein
MYLRDMDTFITLGDLAGQVQDQRRSWTGSSTEVEVHLDDSTGQEDSPDLTEEQAAQRRIGTITLGREEMPATQIGLGALAQWFDIPSKFLGRVLPDEQQFILEHRISRAPEEQIVIKFDPSTGLNEVYKAAGTRVNVEGLVEQMLTYLPEEASVVDWWSTPEEFRADAIVPEYYDRGIGGDTKVGDLTRGGVRVGQNRKQNLAPWVQPYMFRLICTNGMEVPDLGLRVDARGRDDFEVLNMFGQEVSRAFDRIEEDIKHFYEMREVKADDDVTGLFHRMTRDLGLPTRTISAMEDTLTEALSADDEVTMFHLVNHVTNAANDPLLRSRHNARRTLEQAGGQMISDHAARCSLCHSRLN